MKNNKGFTLIELIAALIIMWIMLYVSVKGVAKITKNVRKDNFVNIAKSYATSAKQLWSSENLYCGSENLNTSDISDGDYYILIDTKNDNYNYLLQSGGISPWKEHDIKGYVRVNVSGTASGHRKEKFYVSITDGKHATKDNKECNELKREDLIMTLNKDKRALEKISKYPFKKGNVTSCGSYGTGTDEKLIKMVIGDIDNPQKGDMFSIKNERFYVISSTEDKIVGLSEYNLYLGEKYSYDQKIAKHHMIKYNTDKKQLVQNKKSHASKERTMERAMEISPFSTTEIHGEKYLSYTGSLVERYAKNYQKTLKSYGTNDINVRLMTLEEAKSLGCKSTNKICTDKSKQVPKWLYQSSYWLQNNPSSEAAWYISENDFKQIKNSCDKQMGVRPVVEIPKKEFYKK